MEDKRKTLGEHDIMSEDEHKDDNLESKNDDSDHNNTLREENELELHEEKKRICAFSIDRLLEEPKVPRGRRPNSKYPRVQACKSIPSIGIGMMPLYPVTQPIGFVVEQRQDETKSDADVLDNSTSSDEGHHSFNTNVQSPVTHNDSEIRHYESDDEEEIDVTDDEIH
jgi:hypothetical protein